MSTNWGRVNSSKQIGRGIREVSCEGHGGILITENAMQTQPFLEKLKDYPLLSQFKGFGGGYEFEEDCDASIICFALGKELYQKVWNIPDEHIDNQWDNVVRSVRNWNPDVFTHITGIGISIFENGKLLEEHYIACGHKVFQFYWSYRPSDYILPEGKRIFSVYEYSNIKNIKRFIVSAEKFEEIFKFKHLPIDTSNLEACEAPLKIPKVG